MPNDTSRQIMGPTGFVPTPVDPTFALPGIPVVMAPVRTVVHPTRYFERHTATRYPIVHVFPTHIHNVHHIIHEHYCEYPHTESQDCCEQSVNHCCPPPAQPY